MGLLIPHRSVRRELGLFLTETVLLCNDGLLRMCREDLAIFMTWLVVNCDVVQTKSAGEVPRQM